MCGTSTSGGGGGGGGGSGDEVVATVMETKHVRTIHVISTNTATPQRVNLAVTTCFFRRRSDSIS